MQVSAASLQQALGTSADTQTEGIIYFMMLLTDRSLLCDSSLALTAMNKYPEAVSYFKKALVLDPENDTYKSNLKIAEQKQKEATSPVSQTELRSPLHHSLSVREHRRFSC